MSSAGRKPKTLSDMNTLSDVSPKISNDLSLGGNDERAAERQQPLPAPSLGGEHVLQPIENQVSVAVRDLPANCSVQSHHCQALWRCRKHSLLNPQKLQGMD